MEEIQALGRDIVILKQQVGSNTDAVKAIDERLRFLSRLVISAIIGGVMSAAIGWIFHLIAK